MKKRIVKIAVCAAATLLVLLLIVGLREAHHGYYCDEPSVDTIGAFTGSETVRLDKEGCTVTFSPQKPYFAGFEIFLAEKPSEEGQMVLTVSDQNGKQIDRMELPLAKIGAGSWYKIVGNARLRAGAVYTLHIQAVGTDEAPALYRAAAELPEKEQLTGDAVIGYAYGERTFSPAERGGLLLFILSAWIAVMWIFAAGRQKKYAFVKIAAVLLFLTAVLTWNYIFNTMDRDNTLFADFQADSERLVTDTIHVEQEGFYEGTGPEKQYGLARYNSLRAFSDEDRVNGYSSQEPAVWLESNPAAQNLAAAGNTVRFSNGEEFLITEVIEDSKSILVRLNAPEPLAPEQYGNLEDAVFLNAEGMELPKTHIEVYGSQYGLQGKVFRFLMPFLGNNVLILNCICAVCTAFVFSVITLLLFYKYNGLFAGCFYIVFWLSPWVVNFARNLYWVEFTWFIPMAIGVLCAWKIEQKGIRLLCYFAAWAAITVKALCGYEYISTVMMGLVAFPFIDFLMACAGKNREKAKLLFRAVFALSIAALAGFATAFCMHAAIRGGGTGAGSLTRGMQDILQFDALRRTSGADLNDATPENLSSWNASVWKTVCRYFHFYTEVLAGISGHLFPFFCLVPLCIFAYEYSKKKTDLKMMFAYGFFFLTAFSWFILAKAHSYVHTHMNYVLWYFGFVQICLYVPASRIYERLRSRRSEPENDREEERV